MGPRDWLKRKEKEKPQKVSKNTTGRESFNIGGVYIRKLALAQVLYWGGFLISYRIYVFFLLSSHDQHDNAILIGMCYPFQQNDFTPKRVVVSHLYYAVAKFHTREKFSLWYNNRGEPTPGWLSRHDLWWWYHETNMEPQEGTGVILDVSYWRCRGVPSERMKSRPGVEPRTCRCWVRARVGQRSRFLVQGLLDDGHQLDCDGLALTPIWALVTFDTPQHTL